MSTDEDIIKIKPLANHHAIFLIVLGFSGFFLVSVLTSWFWHEWRLALIFLYFLAGVVLLTGIGKWIQPNHSFLLTKQALHYVHSHGELIIPWHSIQRVDQLVATSVIERSELPYIGIKLIQDTHAIYEIPQRLANKLIHEQKPLIIFALSRDMISLDQSLINFEGFKTKSETIKGPKAAFLHQSEVLAKAFGYQVYLPKSAFDRSTADFVKLLNQCKKHCDAKH